ncbi:ABC transporter substrate binding protein [Aeromonas dhakensis]|uniref:ABC transporter substrate-binding protein n=1 Tax=Aeromonas dhakensis TaxID=196024 RepID=UPI0029DA4A75|nr:ABC transporter substrate binding protein [Aeromonas dhakensis]MDX7741471.1 ABC transporter substrate binding protein [Aeromonas dhakensis]
MTKPLLLLLLLCPLSLRLWAAEILVISSYHPEYLWDQSYNASLVANLKGEHHISHFYMDTKRRPAEEFDQIAERALAYYHQVKPDLVVLGDDNAINYLATSIASLGTPVVFLGMNENPRHKGLVGHPKITGVLERPLLKRNISEMSQLMGGIKKALVLFDSSNVALTAIEDEFKTQTELRVGQTRVNSQLLGDYDLWQEAVLNARQNGYQAIFIGLYHTLIDEQGRHVDERQVLEWTSAHSPVPLFCFWEFTVGKGKAIGGLVLDGHDQGAKAAELVNAILEGAQPKTLAPRSALRGEYVFSKSELARWQLTLPDKWRYKILWRD